jgi:hypothetical protein
MGMARAARTGTHRLADRAAWPRAFTHPNTARALSCAARPARGSRDGRDDE